MANITGGPAGGAQPSSRFDRLSTARNRVPGGGELFVDAIRPRVTRFLDERASNNCCHIETQ